MPRQPKLPLDESAKVALAYREPRLYVRRLAVWDGERKRPLRDVDGMRPGLNIIWSKDAPAGGGKRARPGHGAGKSVFCGLLRYVLGGDLDEVLRQRFVAKLGDGCVGAVVHIAGNDVVIIRSIARRTHGLVIEGADLLDAAGQRLRERDAFAAWERRVEELHQIGAPPPPWPLVLATAAREQSARFAGVATWASRDGRRLALRSGDLLRALALFSSAAQAVDAQRETKRKAFRAAQRTFSQSRIVARDLRARLQRSLGSQTASNDDDDLAAAAQRARAQTHLVATTETPAALKHARAEVDALQRTLEKRLVAEEGLKGDGRQLKRDIDRLGELNSESEARVSKLQLDLARADIVICPYCRRPLAVQDLEHVRSKFRDDIAEEDRLIKQREHQAVELQSQLDQVAVRARELSVAVQDARDALRLASEKLQALEANQQAEQVRAADLVALADEYQQLVTMPAPLDVSGQRDPVPRARIERVIDVRRQFLQLCFTDVVGRLLGSQSVGRARFSGNLVDLRIETDIELDSAAYGVVRVLSFDLAAMLMRGAGRAPGPAFLVHDSPREADMSEHLYLA